MTKTSDKRQTFRRILAMICVFALVLQFGNVNAYAAGIDGSNGTMNITSDSSYIYISYEGKWNNYIGEQIQVAADNGTNLGALSGIVINQSNDGDSGSITVRNAWNGEISGAGGSVSNSGKQQYYGYEKMKWNIQVPVSIYSDYTFSGLNLTWGGKTVSLPVSSGEITEEVTEEKTTEVASSEATTEQEKTTEVSTEEATTETTTEVKEETTTEAVSSEATTEQEKTTEVSTEDACMMTGRMFRRQRSHIQVIMPSVTIMDRCAQMATGYMHIFRQMNYMEAICRYRYGILRSTVRTLHCRFFRQIAMARSHGERISNQRGITRI